MSVRPLRTDDAEACDQIVHGLPHFFGNEAGLLECARAVRTARGWVVDGTDGVEAFLTVDFPLPSAPEITWMAVRADRRRRGRGRMLMERVTRELADEGCPLLSVLTLAASVPERGTDTYAGTRTFYRTMRFLDVRELHPPGWDHAALLLVRPLQGWSPTVRRTARP